MENPNCKQWKMLADRYFGNELTLEVRKAVDRHLSTCKSCRRYFDAQAELTDLLRKNAALPPTDFCDQVMKRVDAETAPCEAPTSVGFAARNPGRFAFIRIAAACVLSLFVAFGIGALLIQRAPSFFNQNFAAEEEKATDSAGNQESDASQEMTPPYYSDDSGALPEGTESLQTSDTPKEEAALVCVKTYSYTVSGSADDIRYLLSNDAEPEGAVPVFPFPSSPCVIEAESDSAWRDVYWRYNKPSDIPKSIYSILQTVVTGDIPEDLVLCVIPLENVPTQINCLTEGTSLKVNLPASCRNRDDFCKYLLCLPVSEEIETIAVVFLPE